MQTVIGAFDDRSRAQQAADKLERGGFSRSDIHIEYSDEATRGASAGTTTTGTSAARTTTAGTTTAGTTAAGAARPSMTSDRRDRGFFSDFFSNLFGEEDYDRSRHYDEAVRRGHYVVVVDATDDASAARAVQMLHDAGAMDVDERARQWAAEGAKGGKLDVVQEELHVGKRELDKGGVRVIQRVSQKPVHEVVRLREERATVQRTPVDKPVRADAIDTFKEGTLEIHERTEEPVVAKTARVVEEVRVGKDVREREETIDDTLRRKDVEVQKINERTATERDRAYAANNPRDPNKRER